MAASTQLLRPVIDETAAASAVEQLLLALGQDLTRDDLRATPKRVAAAFAEMLEHREFDLTTFDNDEGYDELIVARNIPFVSLCEHHLLPFMGRAQVAYSPDSRIIGLSKLARVVEMFSRRLQVQERLTQQVAHWVHDQLQPRGVGVLLEAEHLCMSVRGVRATGATTLTSAVLGSVRDDPRTRAEFLALARSTA
jgi:GTP cyclohydrolase I